MTEGSLPVATCSVCGGRGGGRGAGSGSIPSPARPSTAAPGRVLVADDNADMRDYLTRLLRAALGRRGRRRRRGGARAGEGAEPPDLVLTDVMMPRLDGFGLCGQLGAVDEATATIPIILLVGARRRGGSPFRGAALRRRRLSWSSPFTPASATGGARRVAARRRGCANEPCDALRARRTRGAGGARDRFRQSLSAGIALIARPARAATRWPTAGHRAEMVGKGQRRSCGRPFLEALPEIRWLRVSTSCCSTCSIAAQTHHGSEVLASARPSTATGCCTTRGLRLRVRAGARRRLANTIACSCTPTTSPTRCWRGATSELREAEQTRARHDAEAANRRRTSSWPSRPRAAQPAGAILGGAAADAASRGDTAPPASARSSSVRSRHLVRLVDDLLDVSRIVARQDRAPPVRGWKCRMSIGQCHSLVSSLFASRAGPRRARAAGAV